MEKLHQDNKSIDSCINYKTVKYIVINDKGEKGVLYVEKALSSPKFKMPACMLVLYIKNNKTEKVKAKQSVSSCVYFVDEV